MDLVLAEVMDKDHEVGLVDETQCQCPCRKWPSWQANMFLNQQSKHDLRMESLGTMTRKIESNKIQGVFKVFRERAESRPQYVVLLKDKSFLCTCLMLQNAGVVCRHAFLLIRRNPMFRYHISMIPRRWFHEARQGLTNEVLRVQPFLASDTVEKGAVNDGELPPEDFMDSINAMLSPRCQLPVISQDEATRSWRYSELSGHAKSIADMASSSKEDYHFVERALKRLHREVRAKLSGAEPVEEPEDISLKGRFRTKRIKSASEGKRKQKRRKCN